MESRGSLPPTQVQTRLRAYGAGGSTSAQQQMLHELITAQPIPDFHPHMAPVDRLSMNSLGHP